MKKILVVLGSDSDLPITKKGLGLLKEFGIGFELRIASAHRTPDHLHNVMKEFEGAGGELYIAVAGMSAHLAGVVAAFTVKPVLAVPVAREVTGGMDSLMSMSQMPGGIPVGTMGFGNSGFLNGCILAAQILATGDKELLAKLKQHRSDMASAVLVKDKENRIDFNG